MPTLRTTKRRAVQGFTLVELLVGMAILLVLVGILATIFASVSRTSQLGFSNSERLQNILAITDFIRREMKSALLPVNRPDTNNLQFVVNPSTISAEFKNPHAVFWQAPIAPDQALGDVAAIGYFVRWNTDNPSNPRPVLSRFLVANSTNTPNNFLIYSQPSAWLSDQILNDVAPASKARAYEGLVAENVVALFVDCLDASGDIIRTNAAGGNFGGTVFDSRRGYLARSATNASIIETNIACSLPATVRIGFVVMDNRSAARIRPVHRAAFQALAATNAADYVSKVQTDTALRELGEGLRSFQTEIHLLNAR